MKNSTFYTLVASINLFFIFFLVYKNSVMIQLSFQKQTAEKEKKMLLSEKEHVRAYLCALQSRTTIQEYAHNNLHMQKIERKQMKMLPVQSV